MIIIYLIYITEASKILLKNKKILAVAGSTRARDVYIKRRETITIKKVYFA
jgi:hypothetical protein